MKFEEGELIGISISTIIVLLVLMGVKAGQYDVYSKACGGNYVKEIHSCVSGKHIVPVNF